VFSVAKHFQDRFLESLRAEGKRMETAGENKENLRVFGKRKKEERKMRRPIGLALGFLLLFGCMGKGYWMVNDPYTKTVYYTKQLDMLASGTVSFTDVQTGKMVHLQSSEVKKMTEDEFKAAVEKK
jgi:hypothetical protein